MKPSPFGLRPYDVVRNALDNDFRWRDPEQYMAMHRTLRRHFVERVRNAPEEEALRAAHEYTDIIAKVPWVKDFRGGRDEAPLREQPVRPADGPALVEMARTAEGEDSARIVADLLERRPDAFHVHRGRDDGEPVGFLVWLRIDALDEDVRANDPVLAQTWESVSAMAPLRQGEHLGVARFMIHSHAPGRPSRSRDLAHARVFFELLRTRHCSWSAVVTAAPDFWSPLMTYLGMFRPPRPSGRPLDRHGLFLHDWRAVGVEEWAEGIDARLLAEPPGEAPEKPAVPLPSLSRQESDAAVREALRRWLTPGGHAGNPLLHSRLVAEHSDGNPAAALRELLGQAVRRLDASSRTRHLYAVLTATYESTATQEAVARKLDLSYGTYRRYLSRAVDEVRETMWRWQVRAHIRAEQGARVPPRAAGGAAKSLAAESVARR